MKRVVSITVCYLLLTVTVIVGSRTVSTALDRLVQTVQAGYTLSESGDYDRAEQLYLEACRDLARRENLLALFVDRDHLSTLHSTLAGLPALNQKENLADLEREILFLIGQVDSLRLLFFSVL